MKKDKPLSPKKQAQIREKEYKRKLRELEKIGAYNPKDKELTKYRKSQINKNWEKYSQYIPKRGPLEAYERPNRFLFVDAKKLNNKDRKKFLANADKMNMVTTKRGVIIEKEGQRTGSIRYSKKRDEFDIVLTGKVKWGQNKGKRITTRIPVAPIDHLDKEEERLRLMAEDMGDLGRDDRLSFVVHENGIEGAHRATYSDAEGVMRALNAYHKDNPGAKLAFFRAVQIQKTTIVKWREEHPPRMTSHNRSGKRGYMVQSELTNNDGSKRWHPVKVYSKKPPADRHKERLEDQGINARVIAV